MSVTNGREHDECMICLALLLEGEPEEDDTYIEDSIPEVGAVWPCGHCFHLSCWNRYNKDKCPICNQHASLFSKIFISAPTAAVSAAPSRGIAPNNTSPLTNDERLELERYRQMIRGDIDSGGSERMLLRDMERQVQGDDGARMRHSMTRMMMVQSRDLRKAERALVDSQEECEMTKEILRIAQAELEQAHSELAELKPKTEKLQKRVDELEKERVEDRAASSQSERDKKKIAALQEKLERAKDKLALKNKQLSRRNKLISSHKMELASKGKEHQKACERTSLELERTKRELELLKELDSFTMEGSSTSLGLSMIWD